MTRKDLASAAARGSEPRMPAWTSTLTLETLIELYRVATGNRTPRGAQAWAAAELGIDVRTVRRWLSAETAPTARQLVRLRIAARIGAARRERDAGHGWWAQLRALFARLDLERAVRERIRQDQELAERAELEFRRGRVAEGDSEFAARDRLPGSPRAHLYYGRR